MPSEAEDFCGSLVYMTIYILVIESLVLFSALIFFNAFVGYLRSAGYTASYELFFSKLTKLTNSQHKESF